MSNHLGYWCRKCSAETLHKVVDFNEEGAHHNYAKLDCIKCNEPPFIVVYDKQMRAPTSKSQRITDILPSTDEMPSDNFDHSGWKPPFPIC